MVFGGPMSGGTPATVSSANVSKPQSERMAVVPQGARHPFMPWLASWGIIAAPFGTSERS